MSLLTVVACQAEGHAGGGGVIHTPAGDVHLDIEVSWNRPGPFDMNNETGLCFELDFFDANNNKLGSATIKPGPNSGTVPAGTKKWAATSIPCPQFAGPSNGGGHIRQYPGPQDYIVFGMPIDFDAYDDTSNAVYSFVVRAYSATEAQNIAQAHIHQPIGAALDSRIDVTVLYQTIVGPTSVSVVSLSQSRASLFEMDLNGHVNYATLGNGAVLSRNPSGVWQVEAPVSYGDINGYNAWNEVQIRCATTANPNVQTTEVRMMYSP